MLSVTIIGIGRLGRALAAALSACGYRIDALVVRDARSKIEPVSGLSPELFVAASEINEIVSELVLVATQDSEIEKVADWIGPLINRPITVLHTSGVLSSDVLKPLARNGTHIGSMHPLVSVSRQQTSSAPFHGAYFCLESSNSALSLGSTIAKDLGGIPFSIDSDKKALYHAAAVMASGHLVALMDAAFSTMEQCGLDQDLSRKLLSPLIASTVANLTIQSPSDALTGPFARADLSTVERHLRSLEATHDPQLLSIYVSLGQRSLDLALKAGADEARVHEIRERLFMA